MEVICEACQGRFESPSGRHRYCGPRCRPSGDPARYQRNRTQNLLKECPEQILLERTRTRARRQGVDFYLSLEDLHIPEKCPHTGLRLRFGIRPGGDDRTPTVVRLDDLFGYVLGNVEVVSMAYAWRVAAVAREKKRHPRLPAAPKKRPDPRGRGRRCRFCEYAERQCGNCRRETNRRASQRWRRRRGLWVRGEYRECPDCACRFQPQKQAQIVCEGCAVRRRQRAKRS